MVRSNFHTHTNLSDGKNSAEEMVLSAINKGFHTLGFSEHSASYVKDIFGMQPENASKYVSEINALKIKYAEKINILCGMELDSFGVNCEGTEYVIGSVHYLEKNGKYYSIDSSPDGFINLLSAHSSVYDVLVSYFNSIPKMAKNLKPDIIGHFDLIAKFNSGNKYFDEFSPEYLDLAEKAIIETKQYCNLFEINTGAISRGYRNVPYPNLEILKLFKKHNLDVIINSDAHTCDSIDCAFEIAETMLVNAGFTHRCELTVDGIKHVEI